MMVPKSKVKVSTAADLHCRDACHAEGSKTADDPVSRSAPEIYCAGQSLDRSKLHLLKASRTSEEINLYCCRYGI